MRSVLLEQEGKVDRRHAQKSASQKLLMAAETLDEYLS
jgi:hypothetical protein